MARTITSRSNETIKFARSLQQAKVRKEHGLHLAESDKLVGELVKSQIQLEALFLTIDTPLPWPELDEKTIYVSEEIMSSICESKTPQRMCAIAHTPAIIPPEHYPTGLIIALDTLQDSGNMGTIIRTADAFGASGILLGEGCADPYSPKSLRSAMGSTYHIPVWCGNLCKEMARIKQDGFLCICGHLKGSSAMPAIPDKTVLVIGNEGNGVSDEVAAFCELYRLPMNGKAESLNAAIAAGILIYEISNQIHK